MPDTSEKVVESPYDRELTEVLIAAANLQGCLVILEGFMPPQVRGGFLERLIEYKQQLYQMANELTHFGEAYESDP